MAMLAGRAYLVDALWLTVSIALIAGAIALGLN
jgi:hypothetical protein